MSEQKTAIVLGGTSPHIDLMRQLRKDGYHIVLVDYLDNSPGTAEADECIRESTLDEEAVTRVAREKNASLVISTCIDHANRTCCRVAETLGLPHPYSYETALNVTDKGRMKRIMRDAGIPTSPFQVAVDPAQINWDQVTYPAVVKPVDANSSKGVRRVENRSEAEQAMTEALNISAKGEAIIEGFNFGYEIQVDCVAQQGGVELLLTRQKKSISDQREMVLQSTGSIIPAQLDDSLQQEARQIAEQIAAAFGLENTPFFYQAIVTGTGISVLEFAPRIGGGLSYYLIREISGVDPIRAAIDSFLGVPLHITPRKNDNFYSTNLLYMYSGIFEHIEGLDKLEQDGVIKRGFVTKLRGARIDDDMRSGNRVGAFVVEGNSYADVLRREQEAYRAISILDSEGRDLTRRNLYQESL